MQGIPTTALPATPLSTIPADPDGRAAVATDFYTRNPGIWYDKPSELGDMLERLPGIGKLVQYHRSQPTGVGTGIIDQIHWQQNSNRNPQIPYWNQVNERLVADPIHAEQLIRSGRRDEITSAPLKAWAAYIDASDAVQQQGARLATDQAHAGQRLLDTIELNTVLEPRAQAAYWDAHAATLESAAPDVRPALKALEATNPREARLAAGWTKLVDVFTFTKPPVPGHTARQLSDVLLPQDVLTSDTKLSGPRAAFTEMLERLGARMLQ